MHKSDSNMALPVNRYSRDSRPLSRPRTIWRTEDYFLRPRLPQWFQLAGQPGPSAQVTPHAT
ncbi:hypothetical protein MNKW57_27630 [Biformimicrobium ophioploci]|uniref:Uncharacterized protein n=1 Tax=Biformimicrobium ophioploci TaxID=3036711 RepID=A0ABQ6M284_9GAMM|nr:hypothetical protein MNKW57_27630 [Microbulbifer sp. NKW57]